MPRAEDQAAGWGPAKIQTMIDELKAGDYDHLLRTAEKYFDVNLGVKFCDIAKFDPKVSTRRLVTSGE